MLPSSIVAEVGFEDPCYFQKCLTFLYPSKLLAAILTCSTSCISISYGSIEIVLCPYKLYQVLQAFLNFDCKTDNYLSHHFLLSVLLMGSFFKYDITKGFIIIPTQYLLCHSFLKCELRASILAGLLTKSSGTWNFWQLLCSCSL